MQELLVQADGDFELWADLVEGLDKLPADYVPPFQYSGKRAVFAVRREESSDEVRTVACSVQDRVECDHYRGTFERFGFPVALITPPLPAGEAERYLAALQIPVGLDPYDITQTPNCDGVAGILKNWGWIN